MLREGLGGGGGGRGGGKEEFCTQSKATGKHSVALHTSLVDTARLVEIKEVEYSSGNHSSERYSTPPQSPPPPRCPPLSLPPYSPSFCSALFYLIRSSDKAAAAAVSCARPFPGIAVSLRSGWFVHTEGLFDDMPNLLHREQDPRHSRLPASLSEEGARALLTSVYSQRWEQRGKELLSQREQREA
eukprot:267-Hanusia_phi.AAC.1